MNLRGLQPGDVVEVSHKGRTTRATVVSVAANRLCVEPHSQTFTWRTIPAREVKKKVRG